MVLAFKISVLRTNFPFNTLLYAIPLLPPSFVLCNVVASVAKLMLFPAYVKQLRSGMDLLKEAGRAEACDRKLSR